MARRRALALLGLAWLAAGVGTGARLHARGGVFGEAIPLLPSIGLQLLAGLPWVGAAAVAWWAAGRWPLSRRDVLRPLTFHAWTGLAVVVAHMVALAALRVLVVPPGLRPLDPWAALPADLTRRGPPALAVYAVLVAAALIAQGSDRPRPQDVPGAGRGADASS